MRGWRALGRALLRSPGTTQGRAGRQGAGAQVERPLMPSCPLMPQDFGFRGCTSVEQSILGGSAHLLSFVGSDTMSAAYYVQVGCEGCERGVRCCCMARVSGHGGDNGA